MSDKSLYERLGGYDGIVGAVDDILPRLVNDGQLGRFWQTAAKTASPGNVSFSSTSSAMPLAVLCTTPAAT